MATGILMFDFELFIGELCQTRTGWLFQATNLWLYQILHVRSHCSAGLRDNPVGNGLQNHRRYSLLDFGVLQFHSGLSGLECAIQSWKLKDSEMHVPAGSQRIRDGRHVLFCGNLHVLLVVESELTSIMVIKELTISFWHFKTGDKSGENLVGSVLVDAIIY